MPRGRPPAPDEATVRAALTVQFDACHACRACVSYCGAFPLMFDLIHGTIDGTIDGRSDGGADRTILGTASEPGRTAGDLTVAEQDRIADACVRCGRCVTACGYGYDVPAMADQALAMRRATGQLPLRRIVRGWWRRTRSERRTT